MPNQSLHEPTVLVVDDDPSVRALLAFLLRLYLPTEAVVTATDGCHALHYLDAHAISLVLTDHQMPQMTGLELVDEVKRRRPDACVILISGDLLDDVEQQARAHGVDYFLAKPFPVDDLKAILDRVLVVAPYERAVGSA